MGTVIVVATGEPVLRYGLVELLQQAGAARGHRDVQEINGDAISLAIVDEELLAPDPAAAVAALQRRLGAPVLPLTREQNRAQVARLAAGSPSGLLSSQEEPEEFLRGVQSVLRGSSYVPQTVARTLAHTMTDEPDRERPRLTPRETQIMRCLTDGATVAATGVQLHISRSTVKTHLREIYRKLGVQSRSAAVGRFVELSLVERRFTRASPELERAELERDR